MLVGPNPSVGKSGGAKAGIVARITPTQFSGYPDFNSPVLSTLGAKVGDFCIYLGGQGTGVSSGSGEAWTSIKAGSSSTYGCYCKFLKAADVNSFLHSTSNLSNSQNAIILRGVASIAIVGSVTFSTDTAIIAGFAKNSQYIGTFSVGYGLSTTGGRSAVDPTNPPHVDFDPDFGNLWIASGKGALMQINANLSALYADGADITVSGLATQTSYLTLVEMRG